MPSHAVPNDEQIEPQILGDRAFSRRGVEAVEETHQTATHNRPVYTNNSDKKVIDHREFHSAGDDANLQGFLERLGQLQQMLEVKYSDNTLISII